jgi:hypothetical protein
MTFIDGTNPKSFFIIPNRSLNQNSNSDPYSQVPPFFEVIKTQGIPKSFDNINELGIMKEGELCPRIKSQRN